MIDGTPQKRMFWSIISDYDLRTAICELVDNALDHWITRGRRTSLAVSVELDPDRQTISVHDNAGGVSVADLKVLVAPGGSLNDPSSEVIGVFGVGSKRAGVALGEVVEIRTRKGRGPSMAIVIDPDWLASDDWELASYEVPEITPDSTEVSISNTRRPFRASDVERLRLHLADTYANFIDQNCTITLNGSAVSAHTFDKWAYPPEYPPRRMSFDADFGDAGSVTAHITGGLILDRSPDEENYGVYFYCNDRLIAKDVKTRDVGYFVASEAGVPHPDASLCRVIVELSGPAQLMPWTSNKSGINYDHDVFRHLRPIIVQLVSYYTKLSRRTKDNWRSRVFQYDNGEVEDVEPGDLTAAGKLKLMPLPRSHRTTLETAKSKNAAIIKKMPWTLGLVEAIGVADAIMRQKLDTKGRIALILIDSTFEIALKEFIVHRSDLFPPKVYNDAKIKELFTARHNVVNEVANKIPGVKLHVSTANHYYMMRNKLIHERATMDVTLRDVDNYRDSVEQVLKALFGLKFSHGH